MVAEADHGMHVPCRPTARPVLHLCPNPSPLAAAPSRRRALSPLRPLVAWLPAARRRAPSSVIPSRASSAHPVTPG